MELRWKETRDFIGHYLLGYLIICVCLLVGMKWYRARNFSAVKLETMLSTVSKKRDISDDPCKYAIVGEPTAAELDYVKVNIYCSYTSKSLNSMDMRAIKDKTVAGAIKELGRINGFSVQIQDNKITIGNRADLKNDFWICLNNRVKVSSFSEPLIQKGTINCFNGLDDAGINKFYETL